MNPRHAKLILKQYAANEAINAHTDNLVMLAYHYEDDQIIQDCERQAQTKQVDYVGPRHTISENTQKTLSKFYYRIKRIAAHDKATA